MLRMKQDVLNETHATRQYWLNWLAILATDQRKPACEQQYTRHQPKIDSCHYEIAVCNERIDDLTRS